MTRRDYCSQEIVQKLQQKGHLLEKIASVVADLSAVGLINDDRYTENYIYARRNKGYGPKRIALELKARGITDEVIAQHLNIADNAWLDEVSNIWRKHFKGKKPQGFAERMKQMRYLQYRGFTTAQIEHVVAEE